MTHSDFRQMAEVVYNRLKLGNTETNGKLEFDSTFNYIKSQSKLDIPISEINGNTTTRTTPTSTRGCRPGRSAIRARTR